MRRPSSSFDAHEVLWRRQPGHDAAFAIRLAREIEHRLNPALDG